MQKLGESPQVPLLYYIFIHVYIHFTCDIYNKLLIWCTNKKFNALLLYTSIILEMMKNISFC